MKKITSLLMVLVLTVSFVLPCTAQEDFATTILRSGLLGAGAGAIGGAASGAKGRDVWKGALAGAGVNIVGGALLDSITRQTTVQTRRNYRPAPQYYPAQTQRRVTYTQPAVYSQPQAQSITYSDIYQEGYYAGYKEGYAQGLRDGMREAR